MSPDTLTLIRYRLSQAHDSLDEAKLLLKEGMSLRSVMNRLYYALFYAALALLQEKNIGTSKHRGVISAFDKEFIKTGIFDKDLSKTLHHAFDLRQKGDYMEQADIMRGNVDELLPKAIDFVNKVEHYLLQES